MRILVKLWSDQMSLLFRRNRQHFLKLPRKSRISVFLNDIAENSSKAELLGVSVRRGHMPAMGSLMW